MINEQIKKYIQDESQKGSSREDITKKLILNGWNISDIEQAFSEVNSKQASVSPSETTTPAPGPSVVASNNTPIQLNNKSIIGLVLGVLGLGLFWFPLVGILVSIAGIILSVAALKNNKTGIAIAGIIIGSIAFILGSLVLIGEKYGDELERYIESTENSESVRVDDSVKEPVKEENTVPAIEDSPERTALIKEIVAEVKKEVELPVEYYEGVIMTDVTAHANAIRYHYLTEDVSPGLKGLMKSALIDELCGDPDIKYFFDEGITLEYSYTDQETDENVLIAINPSDCPAQ